MSLITHVACGLLRSQTGLPLCYQKQQDVLTPRQTDDKHVQHMSVTNTQPDLAPFFDSDKAFVFLAFHIAYIASKKQDTLFIFFFPQSRAPKLGGQLWDMGAVSSERDM